MIKKLLFLFAVATLSTTSLTVAQTATSTSSATAGEVLVTPKRVPRYGASVKAASAGNFTAIKGQKFSFTVIFKNEGTMAARNFDYSVSIGDFTSDTVRFRLEGGTLAFGKTQEISIEMNGPEKGGSYPVVLHIVKVNNQDNGFEHDNLLGTFSTLSRAVAHKPCVEEFTGMWCGWCPRGQIALEKAHAIWGDKICLIAAHSGDALNCKDYGSLIDATVHGFPNMHIDRTYLGEDPWSGIFSRDAKTRMENLMKSYSPAELRLEAYLSADGKTVSAQTEVRYLYTGKADAALAYVLLQDGMANNAWLQGNYYSGLTGWLSEDPLFEPWVNGPKKMKTTFNHVAIAVKGGLRGYANSIPQDVVDDQPILHKENFSLSAYPVITNTKRLSVAVLLINTHTGRIIQSELVPVKAAPAGIDEVATASTTEVARYNLQGQRLSTPQAGINVVKYSDGSVRKIWVK